ncbi:MAG TPA: TonB family protein [Sphingomicrobium sp.]|nr:TonB family protein [Sphingomicrobium sp.]
MTTYAPVPAFAARKRHPRALLLIVGFHAALLAAAMSARMEMTDGFIPTRTDVDLIPLPPEPSKDPSPRPKADPRETRIDTIPAVVPLPRPDVSSVAPKPLPFPNPGPILVPGPALDSVPSPVRTGPRFVTPEADIKPPYPQQKLRMEEEAVLRLKLSIDERGRVTSVEPVGTADPVFLAAARRHLIARWRYKPATENGRPVPTSTVITLRFQLEG